MNHPFCHFRRLPGLTWFLQSARCEIFNLAIPLGVCSSAVRLSPFCEVIILPLPLISKCVSGMLCLKIALDQKLDIPF
jgi:hypothetical protein